MSNLDQERKLFIEQVVASEKVWGLYCDEGWANADSCDYEEVLVYPFWSSQPFAQKCAIEEWSIFSPKSLELTEFLENWCVGMYKEFILAGINWTNELEGEEIDSLDLALKIIQELKRQNKQLKYTMYANQTEFEKMLIEVKEDEKHEI